MIADLLIHGNVRRASLREPIIVHDTISIIRLMDTLKRSRGQLVLVADEFGTIQGLVTPIDVFEAIAGEFPDEDETPDIVASGDNVWEVDGAADLHQLEQVLNTEGLVDEDEDYHFYRQDPDGFWSHKDGSNPVKRFDAEGKLIWNPQTAARNYRPKGSFLNYKDFCGFWCAPRRKTIKLAR